MESFKVKVGEVARTSRVGQTSMAKTTELPNGGVSIRIPEQDQSSAFLLKNKESPVSVRAEVNLKGAKVELVPGKMAFIPRRGPAMNMILAKRKNLVRKMQVVVSEGVEKLSGYEVWVQYRRILARNYSLQNDKVEHRPDNCKHPMTKFIRRMPKELPVFPYVYLTRKREVKLEPKYKKHTRKVVRKDRSTQRWEDIWRTTQTGVPATPSRNFLHKILLQRKRRQVDTLRRLLEKFDAEMRDNGSCMSKRREDNLEALVKQMVSEFLEELSRDPPPKPHPPRAPYDYPPPMRDNMAVGDYNPITWMSRSIAAGLKNVISEDFQKWLTDKKAEMEQKVREHFASLKDVTKRVTQHFVSMAIDVVRFIFQLVSGIYLFCTETDWKRKFVILGLTLNGFNFNCAPNCAGLVTSFVKLIGGEDSAGPFERFERNLRKKDLDSAMTRNMAGYSRDYYEGQESSEYSLYGTLKKGIELTAGIKADHFDLNKVRFDYKLDSPITTEGSVGDLDWTDNMAEPKPTGYWEFFKEIAAAFGTPLATMRKVYSHVCNDFSAFVRSLRTGQVFMTVMGYFVSLMKKGFAAVKKFWYGDPMDEKIKKLGELSHKMTAAKTLIGEKVIESDVDFASMFLEDYTKWRVIKDQVLGILYQPDEDIPQRIKDLHRDLGMKEIEFQPLVAKAQALVEESTNRIVPVTGIVYGVAGLGKTTSRNRILKRVFERIGQPFDPNYDIFIPEAKLEFFDRYSPARHKVIALDDPFKLNEDERIDNGLEFIGRVTDSAPCPLDTTATGAARTKFLRCAFCYITANNFQPPRWAERLTNAGQFWRRIHYVARMEPEDWLVDEGYVQALDDRWEWLKDLEEDEVRNHYKFTLYKPVNGELNEANILRFAFENDPLVERELEDEPNRLPRACTDITEEEFAEVLASMYWKRKADYDREKRDAVKKSIGFLSDVALASNNKYKLGFRQFKEEYDKLVRNNPNEAMTYYWKAARAHQWLVDYYKDPSFIYEDDPSNELIGIIREAILELHETPGGYYGKFVKPYLKRLKKVYHIVRGDEEDDETVAGDHFADAMDRLPDNSWKSRAKETVKECYFWSIDKVKAPYRVYKRLRRDAYGKIFLINLAFFLAPVFVALSPYVLFKIFRTLGLVADSHYMLTNGQLYKIDKSPMSEDEKKVNQKKEYAGAYLVGYDGKYVHLQADEANIYIPIEDLPMYDWIFWDEYVKKIYEEWQANQPRKPHRCSTCYPRGSHTAFDNAESLCPSCASFLATVVKEYQEECAASDDNESLQEAKREVEEIVEYITFLHCRHGCCEDDMLPCGEHSQSHDFMVDNSSGDKNLRRRARNAARRHRERKARSRKIGMHDNMMEVFDRKLVDLYAKNVVSVVFELEEGVTYSLSTGWFIDDTHVCWNYHCVRKTMSRFKHFWVTVKHEGEVLYHETIGKMCQQFYPVEESDWIVFKLPKPIPGVKSIIRHFMRKTDFTFWNLTQLMLIGRPADKYREQVVSFYKMQEEFHYGYSPNSVMKGLFQAVLYRPGSEDGMSGSLLMHNGNTSRKLCGLHCATSAQGNMGAGALLCQEDLIAVIEAIDCCGTVKPTRMLSPTRSDIVCVDNMLEKDKSLGNIDEIVGHVITAMPDAPGAERLSNEHMPLKINEEGFNILGFVSDKRYIPVQPAKSSFVKTPLHEDNGGPFECTVGLSRMRNYRDEDGKLVNMFNNAERKNLNQAIPYPPLLLRAAVEDVKEMYRRRRTPNYDCYGKAPLNLDIALNGIPGTRYITSMEWDTSVGYPFNKMGLQNKRGLLNPVTSDHPQLGPGRYTLTAQAQRWYEDFKAKVEKNAHITQCPGEKDVDYVKRKRVGIIWMDCMKDEKRPKGKLHKTRIFNAAPWTWTVMFRRYFLAFFAFLMDWHLEGECAVGINPHSGEWGFLFEQLETLSPNIIAGDRENFDKSQDFQMAWVILEIINDWYTTHGASEYDNSIREVLWADMVVTSHIAMAVICMLIGPHPSGDPGTSGANSIRQELDHRVAFMELVGEKVSAFREKVSIWLYGDDSIGSVSDSIKDKFNMITLQKFFRKYGQGFTDPGKSEGDITRPFIPWNEVTFLKRYFVRSPIGIMAPLPIEQILNIPQYSKASLGPIGMQAGLTAASFELFEHGPEVYNHYTNLYRKWGEDHGYEFHFLPYFELWSKYLNQKVPPMRDNGKTPAAFVTSVDAPSGNQGDGGGGSKDVVAAIENQTKELQGSDNTVTLDSMSQQLSTMEKHLADISGYMKTLSSLVVMSQGNACIRSMTCGLNEGALVPIGGTSDNRLAVSGSGGSVPDPLDVNIKSISSGVVLDTTDSNIAKVVTSSNNNALLQVGCYGWQEDPNPVWAHLSIGADGDLAVSGGGSGGTTDVNLTQVNGHEVATIINQGDLKALVPVVPHLYTTGLDGYVPAHGFERSAMGTNIPEPETLSGFQVTALVAPTDLNWFSGVEANNGTETNNYQFGYPSMSQIGSHNSLNVGTVAQTGNARAPEVPPRNHSMRDNMLVGTLTAQDHMRNWRAAARYMLRYKDRETHWHAYDAETQYHVMTWLTYLTDEPWPRPEEDPLGALMYAAAGKELLEGSFNITEHAAIQEKICQYWRKYKRLTPIRVQDPPQGWQDNMCVQKLPPDPGRGDPDPDEVPPAIAAMIQRMHDIMERFTWVVEELNKFKDRDEHAWVVAMQDYYNAGIWWHYEEYDAMELLDRYALTMMECRESLWHELRLREEHYTHPPTDEKVFLRDYGWRDNMAAIDDVTSPDTTKQIEIATIEEGGCNTEADIGVKHIRIKKKVMSTDLKQFMKRNQKMADFDITVNYNTGDIVFVCDPLRLYYQDPVVWSKLFGYRYWRGRMIVSARINATAFHYAMYWLCWIPISKMADFKNQSLEWLLNFRVGTYVQCSCQETVELEIPMLYPIQYMDIQQIGSTWDFTSGTPMPDMKDYPSLGFFVVACVAPLGSSTASMKPVTCSIFGRIEELELEGYTPQQFKKPQDNTYYGTGTKITLPKGSDFFCSMLAQYVPPTLNTVRDNGLFDFIGDAFDTVTGAINEVTDKINEGVETATNIAGTISGLTNIGTVIPDISGIAGPLSDAVDTISGLGMMVGMAQPPTIEKQDLMQPAWPPLAYGEGISTARALSLNPECNIRPAPMHMLGEKNEMNPLVVCGEPSLLTVLALNESMDPGTQVFAWDVAPFNTPVFPKISLGSSVEGYTKTSNYCDYASRMCRYWRGEMELMYYIVKSGFHTGSLRLNFYPGDWWTSSKQMNNSAPNTIAATNGTTLASANTHVLSHIIDLGAEFTEPQRMVFPYQREFYWLNNDPQIVMTARTMAGSTGSIKDIAREYPLCSGLFTIEVINRLTHSQEIVPPVYIIMWTRAGAGFQLARTYADGLSTVNLTHPSLNGIQVNLGSSPAPSMAEYDWLKKLGRVRSAKDMENQKRRLLAIQEEVKKEDRRVGSGHGKNTVDFLHPSYKDTLQRSKKNFEFVGMWKDNMGFSRQDLKKCTITNGIPINSEVIAPMQQMSEAFVHFKQLLFRPNVVAVNKATLESDIQSELLTSVFNILPHCVNQANGDAAKVMRLGTNKVAPFYDAGLCLRPNYFAYLSQMYLCARGLFGVRVMNINDPGRFANENSEFTISNFQSPCEVLTPDWTGNAIGGSTVAYQGNSMMSKLHVGAMYKPVNSPLTPAEGYIPYFEDRAFTFTPQIQGSTYTQYDTHLIPHAQICTTATGTAKQDQYFQVTMMAGDTYHMSHLAPPPANTWINYGGGVLASFTLPTLKLGKILPDAKEVYGD